MLVTLHELCSCITLFKIKLNILVYFSQAVALDLGLYREFWNKPVRNWLYECKLAFWFDQCDVESVFFCLQVAFYYTVTLTSGCTNEHVYSDEQFLSRWFLLFFFYYVVWAEIRDRSERAQLPRGCSLTYLSSLWRLPLGVRVFQFKYFFCCVMKSMRFLCHLCKTMKIK